MAINSAAAAIAGVVLAALLVIPFGLTGGVLTVTASAFAAAVVMLVRERSVTAEALPLASAGRSANRLLLQFGGASLIAGTVTSVVDLVLRSALTTRFGTAANGVYQPAYILGNLVFVQLGAGIATAITPSLARHWALGEIDRTSAILRTAVRLSLVAMVPLLLIVTATRGIIVPAVFSGAFKGAEPILALQLTTELPRAIAYTLGAFLLPAGMVRAWVIMGVSSEVIRLVVGLLLLNRLHAQALSTASVASWVFIAITTMRLCTWPRYQAARRHQPPDRGCDDRGCIVVCRDTVARRHAASEHRYRGDRPRLVLARANRRREATHQQQDTQAAS